MRPCAGARLQGRGAIFSFLPRSTTADHGILPPTKLNLEMIVYLLSPAHAFFNLPFRRIVRAILLIIAALLL